MKLSPQLRFTRRQKYFQIFRIRAIRRHGYPYQLAKSSDVTVTIYSMTGNIVRTLALGHQPAGLYQSKSRAAYWDGTNKLGEAVASGVYFYRLEADDFTTTRKMLILK